MATQHKGLTWAGRIITGLVVAMLTFSATLKLLGPVEFRKQFGQLGYKEDLILPIAMIEVACVVVYLVPQTAVLGAVLLTGYLGGATATHVRVHDPFYGPVIGGVLVWLGVFLRDPRLRELMPLRQPIAPNEQNR